MIQFLSIIGAALVLSAYFLLQLEIVALSDRWYNYLNVAGASILTIVAIGEGSIGFTILNLVWVAVTLHRIVFEESL